MNNNEIAEIAKRVNEISIQIQIREHADVDKSDCKTIDAFFHDLEDLWEYYRKLENQKSDDAKEIFREISVTIELLKLEIEKSMNVLLQNCKKKISNMLETLDYDTEFGLEFRGLEQGSLRIFKRIKQDLVEIKAVSALYDKYDFGDFIDVSKEKIMSDLDEVNRVIDDACKVYVHNYNMNALLINQEIEKLINEPGLSDETLLELKNLGTIEVFDDISKINYDNFCKIDVIKAQKDLDEAMEKLKQIQIKNRIVPPANSFENLFPTELDEIDRSIAAMETTNSGSLDRIRIMIGISKRRLQFVSKKEEATRIKEKIDGYENRLNDIMKENFAKTYKDMLDEIKKLKRNVNDNIRNVKVSLFDNDSQKNELYLGLLLENEKKLENLLKEIENGTFTEEQKNNLNNKVKDMLQTINDFKQQKDRFNNRRASGMFDIVENELNSLESSIDKYMELINDSERTEKGKIGLRADKLVNEYYEENIPKLIEEIEKNLEKYKGKDDEKYQRDLARLEACKAKLNDANEVYRSNMTWRVKAVRGAKKFYKKHKKEILIVTGLAALAIAFSPVIIPNIMTGNLLWGNKVAAVRPVLGGLNKLLGNAIGAKPVDMVINGVAKNVWRLANGNILLPLTSQASLLKAVAMSVTGTAVITSPMIALAVMGVKKIVNKGKNNGNKQRRVIQLPKIPQLRRVKDVSQSTNLYEIVEVIQELNPNAEIRVGNMELDNDATRRFYSSVPVENLKLPEGFYFNDEKGITNKHNTKNGIYCSLEVKDLSLADESKLLPKKQAATVRQNKPSMQERMFERMWQQMTPEAQDEWLTEKTKGISR